jgi:metal-sulfur cluster biosynthetic enzyme
MSQDKPTVDDILKLMYAVYDPEINVSLGESGLVRRETIKIDEKNKTIWIVWVPTTPLCPLIPQIAAAIVLMVKHKYPDWNVEVRIHPDMPNAHEWNEQLKDENFMKSVLEEIDMRGWWQYFIRARPDIGLNDVPV